VTGPAAPRHGQRVVAVTGGGGGIGAAVAEELGRQGAFVVTIDPMVSLDGTEVLPAAEETTAGRIVAAGGSARASSLSVTELDGLEALFADLGRLDAVVNVAGISRPTSFARGSEDDWRAVLSVHLGGYLNVLRAALPLMAAAGHGRVLGITSGSGWRAADAGAYGCAKRAVAALTWQLGRLAPAGVSVNALSPIAVTRMVTAALGRSPGGSPGGSGAATGGLSLGSMPAPEALGPLAAHLVGEADRPWCRGRVLFAGGPEVAVIQEPRLLEAVRTDDVLSVAHVLETVTAGALAAAEAQQATSGAGNPRFGPIFDEPAGAPAPSSARAGTIVSDRPAVAAAVATALAARGVRCTTIDAVDGGFAGAAAALSSVIARAGHQDAVVLALAGSPARPDAPTGWEGVLAEHAGLVEHLHADAGWARAVADLAVGADRSMRLVTLTDATSAGGRSRGQAVAQLARAGRGATGERVSAFAVSMEGDRHAAVGELVAHLIASPAAAPLAGAELVAGSGWLGLRSHPRPSGSVTFGGPEIPAWFDGALGELVGEAS
jgi:NAD(P)-dependent dehydrogenase (short-subunit alcohol dehydrogenase family)